MLGIKRVASSDGSRSGCCWVEKQREQDHLDANNCGGASPRTLLAVPGATSQDRRGLEKVQGRAPRVIENIRALLSSSGNIKAERGQK